MNLSLTEFSETAERLFEIHESVGLMFLKNILKTQANGFTLSSLRTRAKRARGKNESS